MKGLLNLLVVLAALLSLTRGCGLRAGGNTRPGLLQLGRAITAGRLGSGSATGVLATAVGTALAGGSGSRLLGSLQSLQSGGLGSALLSGTGALGSNTANSDLQAGLGTLGTRLGGGTGRDLLLGVGKLAVTRLGATGTSGLIGPGSSMGVSGQQLQQSLLHSGQMTAGYLVAAGATSSTATGIRTNLAGSTVANTVGAIASQAGGAPVPLLLRGGSRPSPSGVSPGGSPLLRLPQGAHHIGQAISSQSLATTSTVTQSVSGFGAQRAPNTGTYPQGIIQSPAGGSSVAGPTTGNSGLGSNGVVAGLGTGQEGLGALSTDGTRGDLLGVLGTTARGRPQGPGVLQGVQQASERVGAAVLQTSGVVTNAAGGLGVNLMSNTISSPQGGVPGQSGGVPFGGAPNGGSGIGSDGIQSGTGILEGQGMPQGTSQIGQGLGGATIDRGSAILHSRGAIRTQMTGRSETTLLDVASGIGGASGSAAPGGGMGQDASGPVSGASVTAAQGLLHNTRQIGQTLGGRINGNGGGILQPAAGLATHMAGRSVATTLNVATSLAGVPGGATPGDGYEPGSSAPGTGNNLLQGPGQGAPQVVVPSGGTFIGSSGAAQQSTTSIRTQMSGSFPDGSPGGQGPAQRTQPTSQAPGGITHMTVSSSSHSASSWRSHTRLIGGSAVNSKGGLPSLPANTPSANGPSGGSAFSPTGTNSGTSLLGVIAAASTGGHSVGGPATVTSPGLAGLVSSGTSVAGSSNAISGIAQHGQLQQRRKIDGATVAGLAIGSVASALALGAIGAGIAGAINSGMGTGGRTISGCGGGCPRSCGRKRRSVSQSKVPAEVLNSVPMDFNRL